MRPQIWVDCDGVLADFIPAYLELVKQLTGRTHTREEVTSFELHECVVSKEEDDFIWDELINQKGWVLGLKPIAAAPVAVATLRAYGRVGVLTSPHFGPFWMHERAQWLQSVLFGFKKREIIFASDKSNVRGDVLIDDKKDNCVAWAKRNPGGTAILFDAPWNQGDAANVHRAMDWLHAVQIVRAALGIKPAWPGSEAGETP